MERGLLTALVGEKIFVLRMKRRNILEGKLWSGIYWGQALFSDGRCYLNRSFTRDTALGSFPKEHRLIHAHGGKQLAVQCLTLLGRWWQISLP